MAYIVDGDATDSEAKEHVACRLDDVTFLIAQFMILNLGFMIFFKSGCKGTKKNL